MLAEMLRAIETKCDVSLTTAARLARGERSAGIPTGWDEIDAALGGQLPIGLHEWFGLPVCGEAVGDSAGCHADAQRRHARVPLLSSSADAGCHCSVSSAGAEQPLEHHVHHPSEKGYPSPPPPLRGGNEKDAHDPRVPLRPLRGLHSTRGYDPSLLRSDARVPLLSSSVDTGCHTDSSRDAHDSERTSPFAQRRGHRSPVRRQPWLAPLCVFAHLAWRAMEADPLARWIAWIGSRCTPYPQMLVRSAHGDDRLLSRSLFIQAPNRATRLWAADLALRSNAVGAVLVDGSSFDTAATRRLHLLAKTHGKLVLSARPVAERGTLSAAITRWIVQPASMENGPHHSVRPRWQVSLIRCKTTAVNEGNLHWQLEWKHGEGALDLSRPLARSAGATETTATGTREPLRQQFAFG